MQRMKATPALLAVMAAGLACAEPQPEAVRGGTAVIGGYVDLRAMNPLASITDLNKAIERYALYMPLVMPDSMLQLRPWLAEAWDTTAVGSDSLVLAFAMRRDIRWHDGRQTTAFDVAETFRYAKDPATAYVDAAAFELYAPEPEVLDSFSIRFRLQRHPDFLEAFFLLPPLPAHLLAGTPAAQMTRHPLGLAPVGNGPFRFVRRTNRDWVFESNPHFPDALGGPPPLDRLVYRMVPEQASLITEVLTGRVDLAVSIRPPQLPQLQASADVRILTFPVPNWIFLAFNTQRLWFADRDVRRAIGMAIDRQALVDGIMGGLNVTGRASATPVHWAYDPARRLDFDPDSARALLDRAGWVDRNGDGIREDETGRPLRFQLKVWSGAGSYRDLAEAVQAQLARVGVAAQPEVVEFNTFLADVQGHETPDGRVRNFDAAIGNWTDNLLRKDDSQLFHSRNQGSPRQWTSFNSPRLDALLDSLAITMDRDTARRLWSEYQQALLDESPLLFLFYARGINAARARLQDVPDEDPRGPVATVRRWWLLTPGRTATAQPAGG
ncbi:MAG TPA: ABC transporter substrate-binding protein [Longimicrobiales bacterium]|nr:ABC transporter substrate-binding protein [Longimicrobiales bacterium]